MPTAYALNRQVLDSMLVKEQQPRIRLGCTEHPDSGTVSVYQDGCVRVPCGACGFEAARVQVAMAGEGRS